MWLRLRQKEMELKILKHDTNKFCPNKITALFLSRFLNLKNKIYKLSIFYLK